MSKPRLFQWIIALALVAVAVPRPAQAAQGTARGCPAGQVRASRAACCWPGQRLDARGRCAGLPQCPNGFELDSVNMRCELPACAEGRARASDGVHCCWPGQSWITGACSGPPTSCPPGAVAYGNECHPLERCTLPSCGGACAEACLAHAERAGADRSGQAPDIQRALCAFASPPVQQRACWYAPPDRSRWTSAVAAKVELARARYEDTSGTLAFTYASDYAWALDEAGDRRAALAVFEDSCSRWPNEFSPCLGLADVLASAGPWQDRPRAIRLLVAGCSKYAAYCEALFGNPALVRDATSNRNPEIATVFSRRCYRERDARACAALGSYYQRVNPNAPLAVHALEMQAKAAP